MSKAPAKRGPQGAAKPTKSRVARCSLAKQSSHKRAKSQNVKHIPKARLEEATAKLDSQLAHVQALYAGPDIHAASKATPTLNSNVSVEGLGDILRGL